MPPAFEGSEAGSDQRLGWPLSDDLGLVTDALLEEQLELIRARTASPLAGVFGPTSITWRTNREGILFLAAGRALLLQLRSEEHTSELQSHHDLVCRLLLEKKK